MADQDIAIQFGGKPYVLRARAGKFFLGGGRGQFGTGHSGAPPHQAYTLSAGFASFAFVGVAQTFSHATANAPGAPQRLFVGKMDSTSVLLYWWGPPEQVQWSNGTVSNGTPDHYIIYRDDGAGFNRIFGNNTIWSSGNTTAGVRDLVWGVIPPAPGGLAGTTPPQPFYVDTALAPSTTYSYRVSAVNTSGVEGPLSASITITTLAAATNTPTLPALTLNPDTWIQPYSLPPPSAGTRWLCTDTSASLVNAGTGSPGPGNTVTGCSLPYALQHCALAGLDVIVCTSNASYTQPVGGQPGWVTQKLTGASGWTYVVCDQDPAYRAAYGLSAGTLPPSTYDPTPVQPQPITCTATLSSGATSATMALVWTRRTGAWYVRFSNGEERLVKFTQGSAAINWTQWNDIVNANNVRQGPGLLSNCTATIQVKYVNSVTPTDIASFATLLASNTDGPFAAAFNFMADLAGSTKKLRIVGLRVTADPANAKADAKGLPLYCTDSFGFLNVRPPTGTTSLVPVQNLPCESIYLDRCMWGMDSTDPNYQYQAHGVVSINCKNFLATQCWCWGITTGGSPDSDNGVADSGPLCFQNCYLECESENLIAGGLYASETDPVHDLIWRYNHSHKLDWWKSILTGNRFQRSGSPFVQTALPLAIASATAANPIVITMAQPENFTTGSLIQLKSFTTGSWTALNNTIQTATVIDSTHFSIPVNGIGFTGATTGGTAQSMQLLANQIKNLFELKTCERFECYGNLQDNCWVSGQSGYKASAFQCAANGSPGSANYNSGYPWQNVSDGYIHDNMCLKVGAGLFTFSGGGMATNYAQNILFQDNLVHGDATPQGENALRTMVLEGPVPNITIDRNTFIINSSIHWTGQQTNSALHSTTPGSGYTNGSSGGISYTPNGVHPYEDRLTITNNILDGPLAFNFVAPNLPLSSYPGLNWGSNLTISDPSTTYPATTYATVPYTSIGFKGFVANTDPPVHPDDWNVTAGTGCNGVSCSIVAESIGDAHGAGGPIGATVKQVHLSFDLFPRTFWQVIAPVGGVGYETAAFATNAAKFNIVNTGPYMGIEQAMGKTFAAIFQDIKSQAMVNGLITRCIHYTNSWAQSLVGGGGNGSTYTVWSSAVDTANWWIRTSYPGGTIVKSNFPGETTNTGVLAITSANNVTSGGKTIYRAYWDHYDGVLRLGNAVAQGYASGVALAANPYLDGYQMDNVFAQPRVTGAWGMDTTSYVPNWPSSDGSPAADAFVQQGQALHVAALKASNPNLILLCNTDYFVRSTNVFSYKLTLDPAQNRLIDIVYNQATIGASFSIEGQGTTTTQQFMNALIAAEAQMAPGGTIILEQQGRTRTTAFTSTNQASWIAPDWQAARFGLGCCCMRNGHYALNNNEDYRPDRPYFMDETLQQNGKFGWLGRPVDPPQTGPRVQGVWYRQFAGGVVFMNPAGNGTQVISLAGLGLSSLNTLTSNGFGDTSINPGTSVPVSSITLQARDGRFLKY